MLIPLDHIIRKYGKPNGVLHLGANIGEEAAKYDAHGIKNVIWVEANPDIFKQLVKNVAQYGHRTHNFCVGNENKETVLHVANNSGQSSSVLDLGTHKRQHPSVHYTHDVEVQMFRIDSLFAKISEEPDKYNLDGIDFLNMDLQGFEGEALEGIGELLHQFKWVYLEVNKADVYKGCKQFGWIENYLKGFGFKHAETAKWIGDWSDALFIKR